VDTFIGMCALKIDHGAKILEKMPFIERFQKSGPSASKASGLISQKRSLKASDTRNFIKREKHARLRVNMSPEWLIREYLQRTDWSLPEGT
jgi:hypothetical protein